MIVEADARVEAPLEAVFDALTDPQVVVAALPGAKPRPGTAADVRVVLDGRTVTYRGTLSAIELDRDAGALAFQVEAKELRTKGAVAGPVVLRLRSAGESTTLSLRGELQASGRADKAGEPAVCAALTAVLGQLANGLTRHLVGAESTTARGREDGVDEPPPVAITVGGRMEETRRVADDVAAYPWLFQPTGATPLDPFAASTRRVAQTAPAARTPQPPRAAVGVEPAASVQPAPPREVRGVVRLVTDEPLRAADLPIGDGPLARLRALDRRRPWAIPAVLATVLTLILVLFVSQNRRRREA